MPLRDALLSAPDFTAKVGWRRLNPGLVSALETKIGI